MGEESRALGKLQCRYLAFFLAFGSLGEPQVPLLAQGGGLFLKGRPGLSPSPLVHLGGNFAFPFAAGWPWAGWVSRSPSLSFPRAAGSFAGDWCW